MKVILPTYELCGVKEASTALLEAVITLEPNKKPSNEAISLTSEAWRRCEDSVEFNHTPVLRRNLTNVTPFLPFSEDMPEISDIHLFLSTLIVELWCPRLSKDLEQCHIIEEEWWDLGPSFHHPLPISTCNFPPFSSSFLLLKISSLTAFNRKVLQLHLVAFKIFIYIHSQLGALQSLTNNDNLQLAALKVFIHPHSQLATLRDFIYIHSFNDT